MFTPYLRYFIVAALVLVGLLLLAGVGGIIYGLYEAVRARRRPCLYSLITWSLAILGMILFFIVDAQVSGGTWQVYFLGFFWDFWQTCLFGAIGVSFLSGSCVFVFMAFWRKDRENMLKEKKTYAENAKAESGEQIDLDMDTGDTLNKDDRHVSIPQKRKIKSNLLPEILTLAVTVVLALVLAVFLEFWSFLSDDHAVTKLISPDGQHEIIVDNASWLGFERASVYERKNPFISKRLSEADDISVQHIDVDEKTVEWTDESVRFPFGYTYYQYYFSDDKPT